MTASYIPLILSEGLAADGEALQLLSIENSTPAAIAKAIGVDAAPGRAGHQKIALLLQWDGAGTGAPDDVITIRVRSPFAGDAGEQNHRPIARVGFITPNAAVTVAPVGGLPGNPPAGVAADFSETFNGKPIPNWGVVLTAVSPSEGAAGLYVEIDFGASVAN
jgi:hypothetical protein